MAGVAASSSASSPGTSATTGVFRGGTGVSFATGGAVRGRGGFGRGGGNNRGGGFGRGGKTPYKTKQQAKEENKEYSDYLLHKPWLHQAIKGTVRPAQR